LQLEKNQPLVDGADASVVVVGQQDLTQEADRLSPKQLEPVPPGECLENHQPDAARQDTRTSIGEPASYEYSGRVSPQPDSLSAGGASSLCIGPASASAADPPSFSSRPASAFEQDEPPKGAGNVPPQIGTGSEAAERTVSEHDASKAEGGAWNQLQTPMPSDQVDQCSANQIAAPESDSTGSGHKQAADQEQQHSANQLTTTESGLSSFGPDIVEEKTAIMVPSQPAQAPHVASSKIPATASLDKATARQLSAGHDAAAKASASHEQQRTLENGASAAQPMVEVPSGVMSAEMLLHSDTVTAVVPVEGMPCEKHEEQEVNKKMEADLGGPVLQDAPTVQAVGTAAAEDRDEDDQEESFCSEGDEDSYDRDEGAFPAYDEDEGVLEGFGQTFSMGQEPEQEKEQVEESAHAAIGEAMQEAVAVQHDNVSDDEEGQYDQEEDAFEGSGPSEADPDSDALVLDVESQKEPVGVAAGQGASREDVMQERDHGSEDEEAGYEGAFEGSGHTESSNSDDEMPSDAASEVRPSPLADDKAEKEAQRAMAQAAESSDNGYSVDGDEAGYDREDDGFDGSGPRHTDPPAVAASNAPRAQATTTALGEKKDEEEDEEEQYDSDLQEDASNNSTQREATDKILAEGGPNTDEDRNDDEEEEDFDSESYSEDEVASP